MQNGQRPLFHRLQAAEHFHLEVGIQFYTFFWFKKEVVTDFELNGLENPYIQSEFVFGLSYTNFKIINLKNNDL